jgi:hypothetical protein
VTLASSTVYLGGRPQSIRNTVPNTSSLRSTRARFVHSIPSGEQTARVEANAASDVRPGPPRRSAPVNHRWIDPDPADRRRLRHRPSIRLDLDAQRRPNVPHRRSGPTRSSRE